MKCSNCGAELSVDTRFCSYCGQKIKATTPPPTVEEAEIPTISHVETELVEGNKKEKTQTDDAHKSLGDKIKEKGIELWSKLTLYGKITTVSISVFALLFLVALLAGKTAASIIAFVQIALAVVSVLMHKGVIKLEQKKLWFKWLALAIAILFTVLNIMSYSWGGSSPTTGKKPSSTNNNVTNNVEQIDWDNITLSTILPEPQSNKMEILYNGEDWLSVTIHDISENEFLEYVRWCKEDYGFTVNSDSFDGYFYADNQNECNITIIYSDASKEMNINLITSGEISNEATELNSTTAIAPCESSECLGNDYKTVIKQFEVAGFENILAEATAELGLENIEQKGQVYEITINESTDFDTGDEYDKDDPVKILYYDAKKIAAPISSDAAANIEIADLIKLFEDAGFSNFVTTTEDDIDPEYSQDKFRNDVSIANDDSFTVTDKFPFDSEVKIVTHTPSEKYKVTIHINFIPNLLFNKYGVDVSRGYTELGTLSHGEDGDFEMWLKPGKHTLTFTKVSYIRPEKEVTFEIKGESEIYYDLSCYEDSIHIEKTAHIDMGAVGEGEVAVTGTNSDFKYKDYKEVETELLNAGFSNITTKILYDIVWGWTDEGEVDSVKIDGKTDYILGDVFAEDVPIVITYHMPEEDDPSRITMQDNCTRYEGKDYKEVEKTFKDMGFTNVVLESHTTEDTSYTDGEVYSVKADYESFEKGNTYAPDDKIVIRYYIVEEVVEDTTKDESDSEDEATTETSVVDEYITVENNDDFAALMKITDQTDAATIRAFVNSHIGDTIKFEGCVAFMMHHEDFKTRFDVCMAGVDYDADRVYGPLFAFEDVNFYDMNVYGTDTVAQGMNFKITGKILGFSSEGGYIILDPVSMHAR